VVLLIVLGVVYLYGLTSTGMISKDEPRYAAIGRAMAQTGDWVTPRLWNKPWFEKPAALYWMTGLASKAGLGVDLAPRLPVAVVGLGFVFFFYGFVRREFGPAEALYATAVLGTSAGWVAYSFVAVTDVPMAAFFCAAFFLCFEWVTGGEGSAWRALAVGALLGLSVLAKGLVPLVLFAPVFWPMRRRLAHLGLIAAACVVVAGPWYVACTLQNGTAFLNEIFLKHHFARFFTGALQHARPVWFYVPVMLGMVFPWTPLLVLLRPGIFRDARLRFAGLWLLYSLAFFSASTNKLPGYLIPLLPAASLVLGIALGWARRTRIPLFLCALSLALAPVIAAVLPGALQVGMSHTAWAGIDWRWAAPFAIFAAGPLWLEIRSRRTEALAMAGLLTCAALLYMKVVALPATDSVRPFYRQHANWLDSTCLQDVDVDSQYQLQYYAGREFPKCQGEETTAKIMSVGARLILLD
jgi:4-amino-4-deoxy-L-arabinose transferase-like glycosyltransferase